jgi:hypothetical protein
MRRLKAGEKSRLLMSLEKNYGLKPGLFKDLTFLINNKNKVFMTNRLLADYVGYGKFVSISLPFARMDLVVKPTTIMVQMFGKFATKGFIEVDKKNATRFMSGEDLEVENEGKGYVIVKYKDECLGVGLLKENVIKNQVPRAKRLDVDYL